MRKGGQLTIFVIIVIIILLNFVNSAELRVTPEHPFYLDGKWISAKDLDVGDKLKTIDGREVVIRNITLVKPEEAFYVYNLEVPFFNNFIVDLGLIVHNSNAPKYLEPKIVMETEGMELLSRKPVPQKIYDSIGKSNVETVFTRDLSSDLRYDISGENLVGTKAVAYVDNNGEVNFGFFTESAESHHPQIGAMMATKDSTWSEGTIYALYHGELSFFDTAELQSLLTREFGFDFIYDKSTGKIVQIRMNSGITQAQSFYKTPIDRNVVERVVDDLFERIDPSLLDSKYQNLKWKNDPKLMRELIPSSLNMKLIINLFV